MTWDAWVSLVRDETAKAIPNAFTGLILLALGWLVTSRVTAFWDRRKKESELSLAALERFYGLYGEFFAVWKIWEDLQPKGALLEPEQAKDRDDLLKRAAAVEGNYESLIVKLIVERDLGPQDLKNLAYFREGLQCLRESIEADKSLRTRNGDGTEWRSTPVEGNPQRAKAYRSFKALAVLVSDVATHSKPIRNSRRGDQAFWRTKAEGLMAATNAQERLKWWDQGLNEP
ncbi:hypothetical protein [Arthrobacter sp. OAP107]|uniref:hypothetical protein n=1 Tax=Arthrobacter sp. OAP107 TaxID=3156445 RepID=UPI0033958715